MFFGGNFGEVATAEGASRHAVAVFGSARRQRRRELAWQAELDRQDATSLRDQQAKASWLLGLVYPADLGLPSSLPSPMSPTCSGCARPCLYLTALRNAGLRIGGANAGAPDLPLRRGD